MTLSQLAKTSKYTAATIKYFLREGLLMNGQKITERLADYDESHVRRLKLIFALHKKLDMPYSKIKEITTLLDNNQSPELVYRAIGLVQRHLAPSQKTNVGVAELKNVLDQHGVFAANPTYLERLAGTIEEAAEEGIEFSSREISQLIPPLKEIVKVEMSSDIPNLENADDVIRFSAMGMYYTSSVSQQIVRIIEQTMALEAYSKRKG